MTHPGGWGWRRLMNYFLFSSPARKGGVVDWQQIFEPGNPHKGLILNTTPNSWMSWVLIGVEVISVSTTVFCGFLISQRHCRQVEIGNPPQANQILFGHLSCTQTPVSKFKWNKPKTISKGESFCFESGGEIRIWDLFRVSESEFPISRPSRPNGLLIPYYNKWPWEEIASWLYRSICWKVHFI